MKVIIVGGSIAGLTLAHCLEKANIDYVVLEKKDEIAPQEGASIGIMPNGGRILEQLGLYHRVQELIEPLTTAHVTYPDGFHYSTQYPTLIEKRFGYPLAFLDRQKLLEILSDAPIQSKRVRLGQKVVRIQSHPDGLTVDTSDGQVYHGDLVVGADGVHSRVRAEMWRLANASQEEKVFRDEDRKLTINYACIFGISSPIEQLDPGQQITCYNDGWSILSVIGQNGRIFWFLFVKLDKQYVYDGTRNHMPCFTPADAHTHCESLAEETVWNGVRFGQLWAQREVFQMTALEEGLLRIWNWKNIICIGDSMHKFAPHIGQGANCAIEDAAHLSNKICGWLNSSNNGGKPAATEVSQVLTDFVRDRTLRLGPVALAARSAMRLHAREGLANRLLGRYLLPYAGDKPADWASRGIAGGISLDSVDLPARSGSGWTQFKQQNRGLSTPKFLAGLCLLVIMVLVWYSFVHHVV